MTASLVKRDLDHLILMIREQRVILDADIAILFGVMTKALNQAVKRNRERFPESFAFQLTEEEKKEVVTNCDHLQRRSVEIINTFIRLRQMAMSVENLANKINRLEKKYDNQFKVIFDAVRQLMQPPDPPRKKIGFHP